MLNQIAPDAYAVIIGAMKSGTSSMFSYLSAHPHICPSVKKETGYFCDFFRKIPAAHYADLWNFDASSHRYAMEASTCYTKYPQEDQVPRKIHEYGLTPKFIYIIRNPFERVTSEFNYRLRKESIKSMVADPQLIHTSNYFMQLEQYRAFFPREDILIVDFEELKNNPATVLRQVYRHLDLAEEHFPDAYQVKNQTRHENRLERQLRRSPLGSYTYRVPHPLRRAVRHILRKIQPLETRELTAAEREEITVALEDDMDRLGNAYGIDVRRWGFGS